MVRDVFLERLGKRLRSLREAQELTLAALAKRTGFGAAYLSEIERGNRNVPVLSLRIVAGSLGMTLSEILEGTDGDVPVAREAPVRLPQHVETLAKQIARMPRGRRSALLAAFRAVIRAADSEPN